MRGDPLPPAGRGSLCVRGATQAIPSPLSERARVRVNARGDRPRCYNGGPKDTRRRTLATTEFHIATSRCLLEQAEREYRAGDVLQASEKGWGAAAHAVKAIAEGRGWEHGRHGHLFRAARRIANELGQPKVWDLFHVASAQHQNFYEGWLDDEDVEEALARVRELLGLLEGVAPASPPS